MVGQNKVNEIELKHRQPLSKFEALVDELLSTNAYEHITQTFYLKLPVINYPEFSSFAGLTLSFDTENYFASGIVTASLATWKAFMVWASNSSSNTLVVLSNMLYTLFSSNTYFQDLVVVQNNDKTFSLEE